MRLQRREQVRSVDRPEPGAGIPSRTGRKLSVQVVVDIVVPLRHVVVHARRIHLRTQKRIHETHNVASPARQALVDSRNASRIQRSHRARSTDCLLGPANHHAITNSGTGPLIISSLQTTGPFATANTCGAPVTTDCTVQVTFTPTASGTQTGTLTIADNAANSPQTVALAGNVQTTTPPPPTPPPTPPAGQPPSIGIGLGVASGGSTSATVTAGASAGYALSIGGAGISGTVSLTRAGAPKGANCSVPASVPIKAATASSFNVSVTTTSRSLLLFSPTSPTLWLWAIALLAFLALSKAASSVQPRLQLRWRFVPLLAIALCACGGGSPGSPTPAPNPNGTPAGTSTITVTATSGSTTQVQKLTLTVN